MAGSGGTGGAPSGSGPTPPAGSGPFYATDGTKLAATSSPTNGATTDIADLALSGLHYWRGNVGLAIRW